MNKYLYLIIISLLLSSCKNIDIQNKEEQTSQNNDSTAIEVNMEQELTINTSRCIGCGRCANIAPKNFIMKGRKAFVSSQEKTDSIEVQKAIKSCPVQVIKM